MKGKTLVLLVVAAAVLGAVAVWTSKDREKAVPATLGRLIFPDLPVNDVERITLRSSGGQASVVKEKGTWVVPDRYNYPADFARVKGLLIKLADLKIGQVIRADEKQRRTLKMLAPGTGKAGEDETGSLLELGGADGNTVAALLIGTTHMRAPRGQSPYGEFPDGSYVSPDDGESIYLVSQVLDNVPKEPRNWLDQEFLNVPASEVAAVTITGPDRPDVTLVRGEESSQLELQGLGDKEETDPSKLYSVEAALSYLKFEDVADPTLTDEQLGMGSPALFILETKKQEIYTVEIGAAEEESGNRYLRVKVALKDAEEEEPAGESEGDEPDAAEKAGQDKEKAEREELETRVAGLNDRLGRWTYLVSSYKAGGMLARREDLVKAKEEEEKKED